MTVQSALPFLCQNAIKQYLRLRNETRLQNQVTVHGQNVPQNHSLRHIFATSVERLRVLQEKLKSPGARHARRCPGRRTDKHYRLARTQGMRPPTPFFRPHGLVKVKAKWTRDLLCIPYPALTFHSDISVNGGPRSTVVGGSGGVVSSLILIPD